MTRRIALAALTLVALAGLAGCGGGGADLVVYSGRNEALLKPVLDQFARESGLDVSVRFGDTTDLTATVLEEGDRPRADVFIGQDAGALERLAEERRLQPYAGEALARVARKLRAADGSWVGLSARARVLIVNTEEVPPAERPRSVFELTRPRWKGKVGAPNTTNASFIGFITEMRLLEGEARTRRWLEGMKRNGLVVLGSHTDVRNAVGSGELEVGLVNHYYVELGRREGSPVAAVFTDERPGEMGTVVNVASGGIIAGAKHPDDARKLLDFLLTPEVQREFAGRNFEYPVIPGVAAPGLRPFAEIRQTPLPLARLGGEVDRTLKLLDEVGLED